MQAERTEKIKKAEIYIDETLNKECLIRQETESSAYIETEKIDSNHEIKEKITSQICFHSKKNPNKQIQLFEVSGPVLINKQSETTFPSKQENGLLSLTQESSNVPLIEDVRAIEKPLKRRSSLRINKYIRL